jgi:hypothetical protein
VLVSLVAIPDITAPASHTYSRRSRITITAVLPVANERVWSHSGLLYIDAVADRTLYRAEKPEGATVLDLNSLPHGLLDCPW